MSISSRLAVKSLFNSKFDFESTAPGEIDPTRLEVLKSTQVYAYCVQKELSLDKPGHNSGRILRVSQSSTT